MIIKNFGHRRQAMNMNSSESHLTRLITTLQQLSAKEKVGGLGIHENEFNGETVLRHVLKLMALWLTKFLKRPTNKGGAVVKGKHVNRGADYGLEISCEYCFTGDEFSVQWLKSTLERGFLQISSTVVIRFSCTDFFCNKTVGQLYLLLATVMFVQRRM